MNKIYLDNASTTMPREEVISCMVDIMTNFYANADSIHNLGLEVAQKIKKAKSSFERFGLDKNGIFFTAGGGEANNIIIQSIARKYKAGHIISSKIEHPSIIETLKNLKNFDIDYVKVDEYGNVDENNLLELIRPDTILVTIAYVNSELGTIQNIEKLSTLVKEKNKNTYFHTDFVQGLGHVFVNFNKMKIDAISFSSHKIHGPKGVGAIYLNKNLKLDPVVYGSNTENYFVPRTIPNEQVLGFLKAVSLLDEKELENIGKLKEYTIHKLSEIENVRINSPINSSPAVLNFSCKDTKGEIIMNYLSNEGIYVSTGSACSVKKGPSKVIQQLNLPKDYVEGVIRLSFSRYTTKEQIDIFIEKLKFVVNMIRNMK